MSYESSTRRISTAFPHKALFRIFSVGVPLVIFTFAFVGPVPGAARIVMGLNAIAISGAMTVIWRWLFAGTLDTVDWLGDELLLTYGGEEERISLRDIGKVENLRAANPERIKLTLSTPCRFGSEVQFFPTYRTFHFKPHPIVAELQAAINS